MRDTLPLILSTAALLVAIGFVTLPATANETGEWACYIGDKFPDVKAAAEWRGATKVTEGLNQTASHAARGTVITVPYPVKAGMGSQVAAPLVCVKN